MSDAAINAQAIINIVQPFILDAGGVVFAAITAYLAKHIKNAKLREALESAIQRGAGGVYEAIVAQAGSITDVPLKNAQIATAVNSLLVAYPVAIRTFGLTPETLHEMVRKNLGTLLAADPNVTVLPPVPPLAAQLINALPTVAPNPSPEGVAVAPAVPVVAVPANPMQPGA